MKQLMLGDFGVARGAYEAGVRVACAYPGTPSTEITEAIAKYDEVYAEWSPNEKVALEVGIGASLRGARTIVSMKHVGLNVAADPLYTAAYTGVGAGLVIAVADDPGMHSSQNEQDTRLIARAANVPVLEPADSEESRVFTRRAFEISEKFDTPVILRMTTRVAHSQSQAELEEREELPLRPYEKNREKYVMMPANAKKRHLVVEERLKALAEYAESMPENRVERGKGKLGVICAGGVYQYVKEALPDADVLKLGCVYPLPMNLIRAFRESVEDCLVIEELEPHIETLVRAAGIDVHGKEIFGIQGEYSANFIREKLLGASFAKPAAGLPARPPVLCAGCPHRGVFYSLGRLKVTVCGDIGCYTLGAVPPLGSIDTVVCMGASIGMACGMEKADPEAWRNTVAVIGDSTFIHSGITGLIDAVYNKSKCTVIIVDNRTTGMTGHQQHPATGKTIKMEDTYPLCLEDVCRAVGVKSVRVVDPNDVELFERTVKEELARPEVSVVISRRPCVLLTKKSYRGFVVTDKCKKCGMCMKLGCPAIRREGTDIVIDTSLCTECGLCRNVCKFGAIEGREDK